MSGRVATALLSALLTMTVRHRAIAFFDLDYAFWAFTAPAVQAILR